MKKAADSWFLDKDLRKNKQYCPGERANGMQARYVTNLERPAYLCHFSYASKSDCSQPNFLQQPDSSPRDWASRLRAFDPLCKSETDEAVAAYAVRNNKKKHTKKNRKRHLSRIQLIEQQQQTSRQPPMKSRCNYWPNCTNKNCKFVHPIKPCRYACSIVYDID